MWPYLFPLYASQIFKTILPSQLKQLNSFIQKDCVIFYRFVTGNHTENCFLVTSCLSVTFFSFFSALCGSKTVKQSTATVLTVKCFLEVILSICLFKRVLFFLKTLS